MAFASRIKVTTATTGTGSLTLSATGVRDATNGDFLSPAERASRIGGLMVPYHLNSGANTAFGVGRLSLDGLTLERDADEKSWNGTTFVTAKLSLTGTSTVIISPRAQDLSAGNIGKTIAARMGAYLA